MKKQILLELMEINNIPASYFVLGRDAMHQSMNIGLEEVVDLVEVATNEDGDIVIRPREGMVSRRIALREAIEAGEAVPDGGVECRRAIMIKRMHVGPHRTESPKIRLAELTVTAKRMTKQSAATTQPRLSPVVRIPQPERSPERESRRSSSPRDEGAQRRILEGPRVVIAARQTCAGPKPEARRKTVTIPPPPAPPKPGVRIYHEPDEHLANHPINVTIRLINEFSAACFKPKQDTSVNKGLVLALGRKLGLGLSRSQLNNPDFAKNKELITALKEKLLKVLFLTLNRENDITPDQIYNAGYCRVYVGNGNNPMMVKSVLKQRWWWTTADSSEGAHLVWTQWKKAKFIESLPCVSSGTGLQSSSTTATKASGELTGSSTDLSEGEEGKSAPLHVAANTNSESVAKSATRMCNHVEGNVHLGNKKGLFYNMKEYYEALGKDPFLAIPLTFHIQHGVSDPQFEKFTEVFLRSETAAGSGREEAATREENVWIVKPGENTNRGHGISVCRSLAEIKRIVSDCEHGKHTFIVQKYIERPLLVNKRKFDIRCYGLVTAYNGHVKGYFYKEGYLRTASREFTLKNITAKIIHLTNEAVQQKYDDFGKFEPGNKMTYLDLNKYIESVLPDCHVDFFQHLLPQIKKLVTDTMRATHGKLDPKGRQQTFELFGYDFMIDADFHVFLIEANINPCLEIKSPVTARIVPAMLDSALRIAVDPIFQPAHEMCCGKKSTVADILPEIRHELIYDSGCDGPELLELGKHHDHVILELGEDEEEEEDANEPEAKLQV